MEERGVRLVRTSVRTHVTYVDVEVTYPDETPTMSIRTGSRNLGIAPKWRRVIQLLKTKR
jgi:hypothetical protein